MPGSARSVPGFYTAGISLVSQVFAELVLCPNWRGRVTRRCRQVVNMAVPHLREWDKMGNVQLRFVTGFISSYPFVR